MSNKLVFVRPWNKEVWGLAPEGDITLCRCGMDLRGSDVWGYPHDGGNQVGDENLWLYVHCPKCGYEMALWKLGVPQSHHFEAVK